MAIRPVLPILNYAIHYNYIAKNLCEKRNVPQSTCNGKCYVKNELAKSEKQSNNNQNIKILNLDVFLFHETLCFLGEKKVDIPVKTFNFDDTSIYYSEYISRIFHPPLV